MFCLFTLIEEDGGIKIAQLDQPVIQFFQSYVSSSVFWFVIKDVFKYKQFGKDFWSLLCLTFKVWSVPHMLQRQAR